LLGGVASQETCLPPALLGISAFAAYKLEQMTGEPLTGTFRREELLVIPEMETEYLPGRTQTGLSQKLSSDNTIPKLEKVDGKWKSVLNGDSWAEKEVAKLTDEDVGNVNREKLLWRLVTYLRQGNTKPQALRRLRESLDTGPDTSAPLAIVTGDEVQRRLTEYNKKKRRGS
jgi:hypothetical protein